MNSVSQENMFMTQTQPTFLPETSTFNVLPLEHSILSIDNNNKQSNCTITGSKNTVSEVWTKNNFNNRKINKQKLELNLASTKMSWTNDQVKVESEKSEEKNQQSDSPETSPTVTSPVAKEEDNSHHARRPMNAFLIFCKKHRSIVKEKYPNSENRAVTRILGEWWAQLNTCDKAPYTDLAKELKDAFFALNPDFKWYKLPAPPLRTLNTRPANVQKPSSPTLTSPINITSPRPEFTPGKLADESQLGSLTSLMNMNSSFNSNNKNESNLNNNNNNDVDDDHVYDLSTKSPLNLTKNSLPPKPLKKRVFENFVDNNNKEILQNVFNFDEADTHISDTSERPESSDNGYERNMTKQDLLNKVIHSMFEKQNGENRKSERSCKGKRYEQFMVENKLLSNKRDKMQYVDVNKKFDDLDNLSKTETPTPNIHLNKTIKRLAERTHYKIEDQNPVETKLKEERTRSLSETSDDSTSKSFQTSFDLDAKINNLPSLSYDSYLQKKRESKKRKIRSKSESSEKNFTIVNNNNNNNSPSLIGSKKRKNKQSITHLEKVPEVSGFSSDLSGLATLAEIAAITEKIDEK